MTDLWYNVAVAQERHLWQWCMSQLTLSLITQKLDKQLDTVVFERRKNQITLTPMED